MAISPNDLSRYILFQNRHDDDDDDHDHDHDHDDTDASDAIVAKAVAMCVLFTASMLLGCLPLQLSKWLNWKGDNKNNSTVTVLLCIGGGILMATTFLHLLPEVNEQMEELEQFSDLPFASAELFMCVGFFAMYFVEECIHFYLERRHGILKRTFSVRRGEKCEEDGKAKLDSIESKTLESK